MTTYPISKYGISSIYEISKLTNREIIIEDIPVIDKDVAKFMSKEFLISNPTASASNTNLILVTKELASTVIEELNKNKFEPKIIGKIGKTGTKELILRIKIK